MHGGPLPLWIQTDFKELPTMLQQPIVTHLGLPIAWAGFLFDAAIAPLLFWRPTRYRIAFPGVLMFNTINKCQHSFMLRYKDVTRLHKDSVWNALVETILMTANKPSGIP